MNIKQLLRFRIKLHLKDTLFNIYIHYTLFYKFYNIRYLWCIKLISSVMKLKTKSQGLSFGKLNKYIFYAPL